MVDFSFEIGLRLVSDKIAGIITRVYNPSYSGGRDQEDHSSKPAWVTSSGDPILKIPNTKGLVEWFKV
jgi:hypothetical protein